MGMTGILALLLLPLQPAEAAKRPRAAYRLTDVKGSSDHPLLSRFTGSVIISHRESNYDELELPRSGIKGRSVESLKVKGKATRIFYFGPEGQGPAEVHHNYRAALEKAGFQVLFEGSNRELGGYGFKSAARLPGSHHCVYETRNQRYLLAQAQRGQDRVTVSVYTSTCLGGMPGAFLTIVESREAREGLVQVDAEQMWRRLQESGSVSLYGIYFDFDSAAVKPESDPAMKEIAKLMAGHSELKLAVVGHTDLQGTLEYNLDLSDRRAKAVIEKLSSAHGVAKSRLLSKGVGPFAPKASNLSEETRAQNRRVELVQLAP